MKPGVFVLGIAIAGVAAVVWFVSGGWPLRPLAVTPSPEPDSAAQESVHAAPKPKVKRAKPTPIETKAPEEPLSPPTAQSAAPITLPVAPELPFPSVKDVPVGASGDVLLTEFHAPSVRTSSAERGQLLETYVYSAGKHGRDTWVRLRDGRVAESFTVPHDQLR